MRTYCSVQFLKLTKMILLMSPKGPSLQGTVSVKVERHVQAFDWLKTVLIQSSFQYFLSHWGHSSHASISQFTHCNRGRLWFTGLKKTNSVYMSTHLTLTWDVCREFHLLFYEFFRKLPSFSLILLHLTTQKLTYQPHSRKYAIQIVSITLILPFLPECSRDAI